MIIFNGRPGYRAACSYWLQMPGSARALARCKSFRLRDRPRVGRRKAMDVSSNKHAIDEPDNDAPSMIGMHYLVTTVAMIVDSRLSREFVALRLCAVIPITECTVEPQCHRFGDNITALAVQRPHGIMVPVLNEVDSALIHH